MAPRGNLAVVALTIWSIVVGFAAGQDSIPQRCLGEPKLSRDINVLVRPVQNCSDEELHRNLGQVAQENYPKSRCSLTTVVVKSCESTNKYTLLSLTGLVYCNFSSGCVGHDNERRSLDILKRWKSVAIIAGRKQPAGRVKVENEEMKIRVLYKNAKLSSIQSHCRIGRDQQIGSTNYKSCKCPADCSVECPGNKVFQERGQACPTTCGNRHRFTICNNVPRRGCFCPSGTIEKGNDECVKPEDCDAPTESEAVPTSATTCPAGKIFKRCGDACPRTCDIQDPVCLTVCGPPGCFCPRGMVLSKRKCILPEECPPKPTRKPEGSERPRPPKPEGTRRPPRREGTRPPKPEGTRPPRREGTRPPKPEGTRPPKPEGTRPPRREGTRPPKPEGTRPPRREGTRPPKPEGTRPPKPEGTRPPRREGTRPPKPEGTRPPKPEGTRPPRREGTRPPKPEGTRPPRPEGTRRPRSEEGTKPTKETRPEPTRPVDKPKPTRRSELEGTKRPEPNPMSCSASGKVFSICGTACEPSCSNPRPEICTLNCVIGCFCPRGKLVLGNRCVDPEECATPTRRPGNDRPGP